MTDHRKNDRRDQIRSEDDRRSQTSRKCSKCGKDPHPNFFICKNCHPTFCKNRPDNNQYEINHKDLTSLDSNPL